MDSYDLKYLLAVFLKTKCHAPHLPTSSNKLWVAGLQVIKRCHDVLKTGSILKTETWL